MLSHAFGAAFDNPDLIVAAVVGDGEAESGPLAGAWKGTSFLNPARDGAVLPILHLNGYKISGPTVLGRDSDDDIRAFLAGQRLRGPLRRGRRPAARAPGVRRDARRLLRPHPRHPAGGPGARRRRAAALAGHRAAHAEGLDRPEGGRRASGRGHLPRPPGAAGRRARQPRRSSAQLEAWMRCYGPEELFDDDGRLVPELAALAPQGRPAHERQPARQRRSGCWWTSTSPTSATTPSRSSGLRWCAGVDPPARQACCATSTCATPRTANFRLFCPDETNSNRLGQRLRGREPLLRRPHARHRRSRRRRTAGSWRCSASTSARAGWRATR